MTRIVFKIYISGLNSKNRELVSAFRDVCTTILKSRPYSIEVMDILEHPSEADRKKILATPTIIRERPFPEKRIIGDFRENSKSVQALDFLIEDLNNQISKDGKN